MITNNPKLATAFVAGYASGALVAGGDLSPDTLDEDVNINNMLNHPAIGAGSLAITPNRSILRLKEGTERFMITDINNPASSAKAQSEIWVMDDWVSTDTGQEFNHVPGGSNVLYQDGHVEFVKYQSEWPVNAQMAILQSTYFGDALGL